MTTTGGAGSGIAALRALVDEVESLPRVELLGLQRSVVEVRREADVLLARVAAEIARRSEPEPGTAGLSRREGFQSPQALVASVSGGSAGEAGRLARVGKVMADAARAEAAGPADGGSAVLPGAGGSSDTGSPATATRVFPVLAAALSSGQLSVDVGALLADALARVADALTGDALASWECRVVDKAIGLPLVQVRRMVAFAEAQVTPKTLEAREERAYRERFATMRPQADGSMLLTARLDPVSAAPVRAMIDGYVRRAFQQRDEATRAANAANGDWPGFSADGTTGHGTQSGNAGASAGLHGQPTRAMSDATTAAPTAGQLRADALAWIARHASGCEDSHAGIKTTVVVRMTLEDLKNGEGVAEIDGYDAPLSISAARQLAADAEIIPAVLGGNSEILDWGRTRRLFTRAQRLALIERDGGCAKCHAPPDWCEAHHIKWWDRDEGPTDLDNGIMLCVRCHHDIHRDGWDINVKDNHVYFTPPRHVDPTRTPQPGGRTRITLAA